MGFGSVIEIIFERFKHRDKKVVIININFIKTIFLRE